MPSIIPAVYPTFSWDALKQELSVHIKQGSSAVQRIQEKIAGLTNTAHALAFQNYFTAYYSLYTALGLNAHDRLFLSTKAPYVALSAAWSFNALPVLIDLDQSTGNMDIALLIDALSKRRSRGSDVIIANHFAGIPLDLPQIGRGLKNNETIIIEDMTQALGGSYLNGQSIGSAVFSDCSIWDLFFGSAVLSNDSSLAEKLISQQRRVHVDEKDELPSSESCLSDVMAALLLCQKEPLHPDPIKTSQNLRYYRRELLDIPYISMMPAIFDSLSCPHTLLVQIDYTKAGLDKKRLQAALLTKGIETKVPSLPLYHHPFYQKKYGSSIEPFPRSEIFYQLALELPLNDELTEENIAFICETLKRELST